MMATNIHSPELLRDIENLKNEKESLHLENTTILSERDNLVNL